MAGKKSVYLEEYLAAHNSALEAHPCYRSDMEFTQVDANGNLTLKTQEKVINSEDLQVFNEVAKLVEETHTLIRP